MAEGDDAGSSRDQLRQAAMVISDLLAMGLSRPSEAGRSLYCWEREGLKWILEQRARDPDTPINAWTADLLSDGRSVEPPGAAGPSH